MRLSGIRFVTALGTLGALPLAAMAHGGGSVDRSVVAGPNDEVVISNVAGTVEVRGWDRSEVQVKGEYDEGVERVDVDSSGGRTVVKVIPRRGNSDDSEATLTIQVPKMSSVEVSAVSADVTTQGLFGTQRLKTVSGEITADVSGDDSELHSVSGDLTVRGTGKPISLRVSSVSGGVEVSNGAGSLDVVTVSGNAHVQMGETTAIRARTTSGDLNVRAKLTKDGRIDAEGVSGDLTLNLGAPSPLSLEIESFSGDISGCLATSVERVSKYGPGERLNVRNVEAGPRVRAKTLSGDIEICDK